MRVHHAWRWLSRRRFSYRSEHVLTSVPSAGATPGSIRRVLVLTAIGTITVLGSTMSRNEENDFDATSLDQEEALHPARREARVGVRPRVLISSAAVRGDRAHMEDTSFISSCKRFAAIFDGHGGAAVSNYLAGEMCSTIIAQELEKLDDCAQSDEQDRDKLVELMLKSSFEKADAHVLVCDAWKHQGSTAVGVLLHHDMIYSFNVGDSRAVLSRGGDAVELTRDHKPNDPIELARIVRLGGNVRWYGYVDAQGEPIEEYGAYRVNGNLAVARAIGDRDSRPYVSGDVEIKCFVRDPRKDEFIVIASDGLWDVFSSEEVVTFVHDVLAGELGGRESWRSGGHADTRVPIFEWTHQYRSDRSMIQAAQMRRKTQIANYLVQEALFRGTSDNVSVIVIWLQ